MNWNVEVYILNIFNPALSTKLSCPEWLPPQKFHIDCRGLVQVYKHELTDHYIPEVGYTKISKILSALG